MSLALDKDILPSRDHSSAFLAPSITSIDTNLPAQDRSSPHPEHSGAGSHSQGLASSAHLQEPLAPPQPRLSRAGFSGSIHGLEQAARTPASSPSLEHLDGPTTFPDGILYDSYKCSFPPILLEWRDLSYSVKVRARQGFLSWGTTTRVILNRVSGYLRSGQMLGILGTSGSGKTTLLNLLAQRIAPRSGAKLEGDLLLNGEPYRRRFGRLVAFISQHLAIYPTLTAREQIGFATKFACQPPAYRDHLLDAFGLLPSQHTLIGDDQIRGLSGGERRRVAVALALAQPVPLLILDEPTSGLDSFNALTIMKLMHRIAKGGYAVAVTLHQPRTDIFKLFDTLLILTRGEPAYFGPAKEAVDFFQGLGHICPHGINFADFLVDTSTIDERGRNVEASRERVREIVAGYRASDSARAARRGGGILGATGPDHCGAGFSSQLGSYQERCPANPAPGSW